MMRALILAAIVPGALPWPASRRAQRPRIPPTVTISNVRDNLYVIPGAGGNTVVFVTRTGVVLVDTKLANDGEAIMKQVRAVTIDPMAG